jgi:hypothetical protein
MATVNVYTAERMAAIEAASVVDGDVIGDNLILERNDGTTIDAGNVRGPQGAQGIQGVPGVDGLNAAFLVRAASPGTNISRSGTQTIDGVALVAGDRVLCKNQTTASENGIYVVAAGAWTRATDADTSLKIASGLVRVQSGTTNGGTRWVTTFRTTDTLGSTAMNWYRDIDGSNMITFISGGTTAADGSITIAHGLPWTPSQVLHSNGNPFASFAVLWGVDNITATDFRARFMNASTAGALASVTIGVARWTCIR